MGELHASRLLESPWTNVQSLAGFGASLAFIFCFPWTKGGSENFYEQLFGKLHFPRSQDREMTHPEVTQQGQRKRKQQHSRIVHFLLACAWKKWASLLSLFACAWKKWASLSQQWSCTLWCLWEMLVVTVCRQRVENKYLILGGNCFCSPSMLNGVCQYSHALQLTTLLPSCSLNFFLH